MALQGQMRVCAKVSTATRGLGLKASAYGGLLFRILCTRQRVTPSANPPYISDRQYSLSPRLLRLRRAGSRRRMSDERGGVRSQYIRASLQEILRVALAQVFYPRDVRVGGMQAISQLLLGEPAELPPCSDEMRATPLWISDPRHAARLLLT